MKMTITFHQGKKVDAHLNTFTIHTDRPIKDGGGNSAPSPFQHFIASIGTCTGLYVLAFCQKRHIPTQNINLHLNAERNQKTHMIETIDISIQVPSNFPKQYEKAVLKTASLCTVKKHLENPPQINLSLSSE